VTPPGAVLVVDDDADIRETIALLLAADGYTTLEARGGQEALALLHRGHEVAVILVDLRMPDMTGTELIGQLKDDPELARIPVVVMSGDNAACAIARSIGADECLVKPVELPTLLATADRYVHR
jgi:two-component system, chemotaxis family, sensor histidine kinase and response regulator PixL